MNDERKELARQHLNDLAKVRASCVAYAVNSGKTGEGFLAVAQSIALVIQTEERLTNLVSGAGQVVDPSWSPD